MGLGNTRTVTDYAQRISPETARLNPPSDAAKFMQIYLLDFQRIVGFDYHVIDENPLNCCLVARVFPCIGDDALSIHERGWITSLRHNHGPMHFSKKGMPGGALVEVIKRGQVCEICWGQACGLHKRPSKQESMKHTQKNERCTNCNVGDVNSA